MNSKAQPFFLPYQQKWIEDKSRLKLMEKSRQIGMSWTSAYRVVRAQSMNSTRLDAWISSRDETQAKLFLEDGPTPWTWLSIVTDDSADTVQCFVNGVAVGSSLDISGLTLANGSYRAIAMGARQSSSLENFTTCNLAQYLLFNEAHSSSVITAKVGLASTEPLITADEQWGVLGGASGCVAWYDFSRDQVGWQVHDRSTNQHDAWATATGAAWSHPTHRGFVRDSHLDIEGVLHYIGSSTQDALPIDGVWTELILDNHNASSATNVDIEMRDDSNNNANIFNNVTLATGKSVRSLSGINQSAGLRYLAFGDTEAQTTNGDDISITAYYEVID